MIYAPNSLSCGTGNFFTVTGKFCVGTGTSHRVSGKPEFRRVSEAEDALLLRPIQRVGDADQALEGKLRRLAAVENRGLDLRRQEGELGAGADEGGGHLFPARDVDHLDATFRHCQINRLETGGEDL